MLVAFFCFLRGCSVFVDFNVRFPTVTGKFSWSLPLTNENNIECWLALLLSFSATWRSWLLNEFISISPNGWRVEPDEHGSEEILSLESFEWSIIGFESKVFSSIVDKSKHRFDFLN